jgi:hypothetical protein
MLYAIIIAFIALQILTGLTPHVGVYRGTVRNAAGVAQLGTAESVTTAVTLSQTKDSVLLSAITRSGTERIIGSWPNGRVIVSGTTITAKGVKHGPLPNRRSLTWTISGGIRVQAELNTLGTSSTDEDFFGGKVVSMTLLKVR